MLKYDCPKEFLECWKEQLTAALHVTGRSTAGTTRGTMQQNGH